VPQPISSTAALGPIAAFATTASVLLGYLGYFRSQLISKLSALPEDELRNSRLPSGWIPLELVKHLTYVELRWLEWGFEGRDVAEPSAAPEALILLIGKPV
jgi:hypothetical protein